MALTPGIGVREEASLAWRPVEVPDVVRSDDELPTAANGDQRGDVKLIEASGRPARPGAVVDDTLEVIELFVLVEHQAGRRLDLRQGLVEVVLYREHEQRALEGDVRIAREVSFLE